MLQVILQLKTVQIYTYRHQLPPPDDSGDLIFTKYDGTEQGRIWISGGIGMIRFSGSDASKTLIHSGNIGSQSVNYANSAGNSGTSNGVKLEWSGSIAWADTGWICAWNSDGTKIKALSKSSFAPSSHTHNYLPSSGGTLSGSLNVGGKVELWSDSEGGNIRLTSPNGSWWSIDALGNTSMRFIWAESSVPFTFTKDGTINATYFSGTANYANNAGYATTADETNAGRGGGSIPWAGSFDSEPDVTAYRSMFSTYMDSSSTWWNLISNRHRNGSSDGVSYGMYIKCRLTGSWAHLLWNRQYGESWQGERTIYDTGNVCISSSNPGNGSFYGQIWFKI